MITDSLVSVVLPVRNGAERMGRVVEAILAQDHENLELVITDNASTDHTEEYCRDLAASESRVSYHRQAENLGITGNFIAGSRLAKGEFFRWISDDDWIEPACVSRSLQMFAEDERLMGVTHQISYTGPEGRPQTGEYDGTALRSDDPVERFEEMLRVLNLSHLTLDPLYALFRTEPVVAIKRRNMLREDQVFATKLALAGPIGHVPETLGHRNWKDENTHDMVPRLGVSRWQGYFATTNQCREMLRWLRDGAGLTPAQQRRARAAVYRMYVRRQQITYAHRGRKLVRMVTPR